MCHSIPLAFTVSALLLLESIVAAPVAQNVALSSPTSSAPTSSAPTSTTGVCTSTITPPAGEKRALGDIHDLDALVFPQMISSTPSPSPCASSSTFAFEYASQARSTGQPVKLVAKNIRRAASSNQGSSLGALADLVFPQAISSSARPSSTQTGFEMSSTNRAVVLGD
ncbi:MAG: hypothetical protein L6R39_001108 [Caloplaca ligustica]|nr:MAG: hypothetical protein L6R39_001108 [Caloplaca ligustica]